VIQLEHRVEFDGTYHLYELMGGCVHRTEWGLSVVLRWNVVPWGFYWAWDDAWHYHGLRWGWW
jgi:hypothetical protein